MFIRLEPESQRATGRKAAAVDEPQPHAQDHHQDVHDRRPDADNQEDSEHRGRGASTAAGGGATPRPHRAQAQPERGPAQAYRADTQAGHREGVAGAGLQGAEGKAAARVRAEVGTGVFTGGYKI